MIDSRKIFVSYKYKDTDVFPLSEYVPTEDTDYCYTPRHYVDKIIEMIGGEHIYKGEKSDDDASHLRDSTIHSKLKDKIFDSSVTVVLLSPNMINPYEPEMEQWIPNEISYSLREQTRGDRVSGTNAILAVALPDSNGSYDYAVVEKNCVRVWQTDSFFKIIKDNMFNRWDKNQVFCSTCLGNHHQGWNHSYILPVKWSDFAVNHNVFIDKAVALKDAVDEFDVTKQLA